MSNYDNHNNHNYNENNKKNLGLKCAAKGSHHLVALVHRSASVATRSHSAK